MIKTQKFAVFDIDGTVYRWQLYHELVQTLAFEGVLRAEIVIEFNEKWNRWRGGELSFSEYENFVVKAMVDNISGMPVDLFEDTCEKVIQRSSHKTHFYPKDLMKKLKKKGYRIIAITGSQQELIDRFGKVYNFDIVVGVKYKKENGLFTGEVESRTIGRKPEILKQIVDENKLSWKDSLAIGDSDGDAGLLEMVDQPIAFNPSEGLFRKAELEGWPIVIERKNIAYRLDKHDGKLVLAETVVYRI